MHLQDKFILSLFGLSARYKIFFAINLHRIFSYSSNNYLNYPLPLHKFKEFNEKEFWNKSGGEKKKSIF